MKLFSIPGRFTAPSHHDQRTSLNISARFNSHEHLAPQSHPCVPTLHHRWHTHTPPTTRRTITATTIPRAQPNNNNNNNNNTDRQQQRQDDATILGSALTLTAMILLAARFGAPILQQVDAWEGGGLITAGDIFGAFFWSIALYFASPFQLLLLFLGKIETERPSDWVLRRLGLYARLNVDAIDYIAPLPLRIATTAFFIVSGIATSTLIDSSLGDTTWSVSSGIGALMAAGLYEVGRPERLSVEEAQELEKQWQDFAVFANSALVPKGRVHESEVFSSFRARHGRYRSQQVLSDARLRDMMRNWNPRVERSRTGWYKGASFGTSTTSASSSKT